MLWHFKCIPSHHDKKSSKIQLSRELRRNAEVSSNNTTEIVYCRNKHNKYKLNVTNKNVDNTMLFKLNRFKLLLLRFWMKSKKQPFLFFFSNFCNMEFTERCAKTNGFITWALYNFFKTICPQTTLIYFKKFSVSLI